MERISIEVTEELARWLWDSGVPACRNCGVYMTEDEIRDEEMSGGDTELVCPECAEED